MSEDSAPKLRLKPKLAADPAAGASQPAQTSTPPVDPALSAPPVAPESVPPAEEAKVVRLKPRLTAAPMQEAAATPAAAEPAPAVEPPAEQFEPPAPAPEPERTAVKFSFKPKSAPPLPIEAEEAPPPLEPAPGFEPPPIPHEPETDHGENGVPAEITAMHTASDAPFPPPVGMKFPAPVGMPPEPEEAEPDASFPPRPFVAAKPKAGPKKKKLVLLGGGALAAVLVLGGGAFYFLRTKAEPPPAPKAGAKPAPVAETPKVEENPAPAAEAPATVVAETPKVEEKPAPVVMAAKPVETPPPPPPALPAPPASAEFKAWVENARISGVRAGSTTRVFIDRTSYAVGDLVNPQLGIIFEGYNPETRLLTFKDATGAKVERRN